MAVVEVPPVKADPTRRIAPVAPSPSLLTSARRLPAGVDWTQGVAWTPVCQPSFAQPFCPPDPTRELPNDRTTAHVKPFTIYTPIICDVASIDLSDQEPIVTELTEVHTAFGLGAALWMGTGLPATHPTDAFIPTLRNSATLIGSSGDSNDLDDAVALLLAAYETCTGGNGGAMIHMPSILAPFALGGGTGGGRVCWPEANIYRGALGSIFVPGPGYPTGATTPGVDGAGPIDSGPDDYFGNLDVDLWLYISGPVEYDLTPVVAWPDEPDRIPFRTNRYEVWGERQAIVRFDPCCVYAVSVANAALV